MAQATQPQMRLFIPLTKVDASRREVWGVLAREEPDRSGEVFDYESSKAYFQRWSDGFAKATGGKSRGNMRAMHGKVAAGKFIEINFNDAEKQIEVGGKVVDDGEWRKCEEGVYTGFSIGGNYIDRWTDPMNPALKRYTADPIEGSLVDLPCIPGAVFTAIKADGSEEIRKFVSVEGDEVQDDVTKSEEGEIEQAAEAETEKAAEHTDDEGTEEAGRENGSEEEEDGKGGDEATKAVEAESHTTDAPYAPETDEPEAKKDESADVEMAAPISLAKRELAPIAEGMVKGAFEDELKRRNSQHYFLNDALYSVIDRLEWSAICAAEAGTEFDLSGALHVVLAEYSTRVIAAVLERHPVVEAEVLEMSDGGEMAMAATPSVTAVVENGEVTKVTVTSAGAGYEPPAPGSFQEAIEKALSTVRSENAEALGKVTQQLQERDEQLSKAGETITRLEARIDSAEKVLNGPVPGGPILNADAFMQAHGAKPAEKSLSADTATAPLSGPEAEIVALKSLQARTTNPLVKQALGEQLFDLEHALQRKQGA